MESKITQKDIENAIYLSEQYQKSIEENPQPLFTLTAEEVENLKKVAEKFAETYKEGGSTTIFIREPEFNGFFSNLLIRIKQWQDENNRT